MSRWLRSAATRSVALYVAVVLTLGLAWLVYWPGLAGGFLFDDYSNLALLGMYGRIDNWQSFWLYLLSGFSGPTGRPLSHLTFLIDANAWPADPLPFKRSNTLIHLTNGILLFGLLRSLLRASGQRKVLAGWIAMLAMALWLLHPFWVSTTLYVVQRMAQLAALFTLAGLWMWVSWRRHNPPRVDWRSWLVALLAVWGFGLLAVLSKENGALLPGFLLVLEVTVLASMDARRGWVASAGFHWLRWVVLGIPLLLLVLYMARAIPALLTGDAGNRSFTPFERLLTEGRILWDYVFNIILPRRYPGGLFNDDVRLSTGILTPWTTALAWAAWIALMVWAVRVRRRYPFVAAAVLFFLMGHVLESSFLQLELYFEHRNYLPAMLAGLPLATWWLTRAAVPQDIRVAVPVGVVLMLAAMTFMRADLWSNPYLQALKWAQVNPDSPRAQNYLADFWWDVGNYEEASRLNQRAIELDPNGLAWLITRVMYQCAQDQAPDTALDKVESVLQAKGQVGAVGTYQTEKLLDYLMAGNCGRFSGQGGLLALTERLQQAGNHDGGQFEQLLLQRRAALFLLDGDTQAAYRSLRELIAVSGQRGTQLRGAAMLASAGHYQEALELLDDSNVPGGQGDGEISLQSIRNWYLKWTNYYEGERESLRVIIRSDLDAQLRQKES